MTKYWIAIEYNIDDDHYVNPLGIFSTKTKAIKKIMKNITSSYNNNCDDVDSDNDDTTPEQLESELKTKNECEYIFGYLVKRFELDKS